MSTVSILRCEDYELDLVRSAIDQTFENLGGIEKFVKPGMKVLFKVNLLIKKKPEEAVTTHPVFVEAVTRAVQEAGGIVTIADSPGGPYLKNRLKGIYSACGLQEVAERTGAALNYDISYRDVSFPQGSTIKSFKIITPVVESDLVINLPKLKTHALALYTGAVKNIFGVVPGTYKIEHHLRMPEKGDFCSMLVDLCRAVNPGLSIIDGITAMEGTGPSAGTPRNLGIVAASENPFALDLAMCMMLGFNLAYVPTLSDSVKRGLCPADASGIQIVGESLRDLIVEDFEKPLSERRSRLGKYLPAFLKKGLKDSVRPKPVFLWEICTGCRNCGDNCPPQAIHFEKDNPIVNLNQCIRCFCCHELCPAKAIEIKRSRLAQVLLK